MCTSPSSTSSRNKRYFLQTSLLDLNSSTFDVAHLVFKLLFREFEDVSMKMWFWLSESSRSFQISKEKIQYLTNRNVVIQA